MNSQVMVDRELLQELISGAGMYEYCTDSVIDEAMRLLATPTPIPDAAPAQQVSVPETYGLPPLPWSLRKCNHIYEDYPESLGGKPGFKPVYLEPFGLCIGQTHLDWPLADFILACVNSAAPATPAADAGLVEALEKIAVYAPCSGIKDPGLTKMHMGILARDALDNLQK